MNPIISGEKAAASILNALQLIP